METRPQLAPDSAFSHGRNRIAHSLLSGHLHGELLDFGCGRVAELALAAARELGLTVHACDIDEQLVSELQRRHPQIDFFAVSEQTPSVPLEDGQVSAVTCCDVLEHIPAEARVGVLRELHRVLADDGVLVITAPNKGLLSPADPENVKFRIPRVHRLVYEMTKGREAYRRTYGGARFGNFSTGASWHVHFSERELSEVLAAAGFEVTTVRYYMLFHPLIKALLWLAENLSGRVPFARPLKRLCWAIYMWDSDLEPGRAAFCIAVRAQKAHDPQFTQPHPGEQVADAAARGSKARKRTSRAIAR